MKKTSILLTVLMTLSFAMNAQDVSRLTGTVEEVSGVPVFLFSLPVNGYVEAGKGNTLVEILKVAVDEDLGLRGKVENLVSKSFERKENGKISDFDGLIFDIDREKVIAIKFDTEKSPDAKILMVKDIAIFFFSKPDFEYEKIADLPAEFSKRAERGLLQDKVNYMVKKALKKVEEGELSAFDAIIFSPDDFTGTAIKAKQ